MNPIRIGCLFLLLFSLHPLAAQEVESVEFRLDNGLEVTLHRFPEATGQAVYILLPHGLLFDDAHRAQFAHLMEHMLIRSHDGDGPRDDELLINGETGALGMRLEALGPLESWRKGLETVARWMTPGAFDEKTLQREKEKIAMEMETTISSGFVHKWADAAWNQVVRHGLPRARVRGDVRESTAAAIRDHLHAHFGGIRGARLLCTGPRPLDEKKKAILKLFGTLPATQPPARPMLDAERVRRPIDLKGAWDLPGRHLIQWYWLPRDAEDTAPLAAVLGPLLNRALLMDPELKATGARTLVNAQARCPEGRLVMISSALPEKIDLTAFKKRCAERIAAAIPDAASLGLLQSQAARELTRWPPFAAMKSQMASSPFAAYVEAQLALNRERILLSTGLRPAALSLALQRPSPGALSATLKRILTPDRRGTLLLEPLP